jgi:hypothetical protein
MVVISLKHKKANNYTVVNRTKIPVLYVSVCIKYIHIEWDSVGKDRVLFYVWFVCVVLYFVLCVNVYCTTATGCQPNCS